MGRHAFQAFKNKAIFIDMFDKIIFYLESTNVI